MPTEGDTYGKPAVLKLQVVTLDNKPHFLAVQHRFTTNGNDVLTKTLIRFAAGATELSFGKDANTGV